MDPLSITASGIAILQVLSSVRKLLIKASFIFNAEQDVEAIRAELESYKYVLDALHALQSAPPKGHFLDSSIAESLSAINFNDGVTRIESIVAPLLHPQRELPKGLRQKYLRKLRWLSKREEIERARAQLKDAGAVLNLQLSAAHALYTKITYERGPTIAHTIQDMIRMQDLEANITHDSSNLLPESALHGKEFDAYHGNPEEGPVREREKGLLLHCRAGKMQTERTNAIMNPDQSSFHQTWKMYRVFFALLGILIISHTHSTKSRSRQHSKSRESHAVMNAASMVYYAPSLFLNFSVGLTWISSPIRSVNLFFPAAIPGDSAIVASIRNNDLDQLQDLLSAGTASIFDTITPYGYTMLTMAMSYGHMEMSRFLRSINAPAISLAHFYSGDAVYYFFRDYTLIHNSIPAGTIIQDSEGICFSHQQVNTIIQHHLQDEETYSSLSHLQKAILQVSPESTCKALAVTRDEDINTSDACEHTALHFAVLMNDLEGVRLLIARGADMRTQDTLGRCPLHIASCLGHVEACSTLLNAGCPHDTADISGLSPLHHAALRGQVDIINILIDHGADINAGNDGGEPPITCAVVADQVDAIRTLLARGADLQVQDEWGCNHILNAVMLDKHEALKVLIELDSSGQDAVQYDGKTLLHLAASNSDLRTIEILCETLNIDVDVEARDSKGFTALEYVMARNDARDIKDAFQSLLQRVSANRSF